MIGTKAPEEYWRDDVVHFSIANLRSPRAVNSIRHRGFLCAVFLGAVVPVTAQEQPLEFQNNPLLAIPLQVGNNWLFRTVIRDVRTGEEERHEPGPFLSVLDSVSIAATQRDTILSDPSQGLLGPGARTYFGLTQVGTNLFPGGGNSPESVYVRADDDGNLWMRAFVKEGRLFIQAQDEPWLLMNGPGTWELRMRTSGPKFNSNFHGRSVLSGSGWHVQQHAVELAQRFLPELREDSPGRLVLIYGDHGGIHAEFGVTLVTGFGPLEISGGVFEFRFHRVELVEATVAGRLYVPTTNGTPIESTSWGSSKQDFLERSTKSTSN
jgi:hypothetical protein